MLANQKLLIWLSIFISFCILVATHKFERLMQVGTWISGSTYELWMAYFIVVLTVGLVSCFWRVAHRIFIVLVSPILITMMTKSISMLALVVHLGFIKAHFSAFIGFGLISLLIFFICQFQNFKIVLSISLLLFLGLIPVAYEFTEQMLESMVSVNQ